MIEGNGRLRPIHPESVTSAFGESPGNGADWLGGGGWGQRGSGVTNGYRTEPAEPLLNGIDVGPKWGRESVGDRNEKESGDYAMGEGERRRRMEKGVMQHIETTLSPRFWQEKNRIDLLFFLRWCMFTVWLYLIRQIQD